MTLRSLTNSGLGMPNLSFFKLESPIQKFELNSNFVMSSNESSAAYC